MKTALQLVFAALAVTFVTAGSASANQLPDFASIIESMRAAQNVPAPVVEEVDYANVDTSLTAFMASVKRQANNPVIPFTKLAMQYVQGSTVTLAAADDEIPYIMVGGYWDTQVSATTGGDITLVCYVMDPQNDPVTVELYFGGQPTGVLLDDFAQPFPAADNVFSLNVPVRAPDLIPAGQYLLELVATDSKGNKSDMWPYLTIRP